jgi:hypothetical protein
MYRAAIIAWYLLIVIGVASRIKFHYFKQILLASDILYLIVPNLRFLARQYRFEFFGLLAVYLALTGAIIFTVFELPTLPVPLTARLIFSAAMTGIFLGIDHRRRVRLGARAEAWELTEDRRHFSNFVKSLLRTYDSLA